MFWQDLKIPASVLLRLHKLEASRSTIHLEGGQNDGACDLAIRLYFWLGELLQEFTHNAAQLSWAQMRNLAPKLTNTTTLPLVTCRTYLSLWFCWISTQVASRSRFWTPTGAGISFSRSRAFSTIHASSGSKVNPQQVNCKNSPHVSSHKPNNNYHLLSVI